jgi:3-methyladenine DNA glycosylase AlkD
MTLFDQIVNELKRAANREKAIILSGFFKTGKGEYGEGDKFLGVTVPLQRVIANKYAEQADKDTIASLLDSEMHEHRLTALLILCKKFNESRKIKKEKQWVDLYIKKVNRVNNWDLVDTSAPIILGQWLEDKDRSILYKWAKDKSIWKNRIAIISTLHFIRKNDTADILSLSKIILKHPHDLIHKATGWMLREAWKRKPKVVEMFIRQNAGDMPRTMLRYAIEKMDAKKRAGFMIQ